MNSIFPKSIKIDQFPSDDGHIESVLIGCETVKVSFQTWNMRALVVIFKEVDSVFSSHCVYGDIGSFTCTNIDKEYKQFVFYDATSDKKVLSVVSKSVEIYDTGVAKDINSALFDVGYDYIGNQVRKL